MILLAGLSWTASAQNTGSKPPKHFVTYVQDTKYQCMVVPLVDVLIVGYRENEVVQGEVINLNAENEELRNENDLLQKELQASKNSSAAKDSVIDTKDEKEEFTKEQERKRKWKQGLKKVGDFFKDAWQELTIGGAAFAVGVGVGYGAK